LAKATLRLLRLRWQLWWNTIRHLPWTRKLAYLVAAVGMAGFAVFLGFLSWGSLWLLRQPGVTAALAKAGYPVNIEALLELVPALFFTMAFLLGLLANLGTLLQSLYLSGDMEFLLAAPLPPRAVFFSKLLQAIFPTYGLLALLTLPALIGLGVGREANILYYVLAPVFLALMVVSGAGLSSLLVMGIVRIISPRRAVELIAFIGGISAFLCSQSGQFAGEIGESVLTPDRVAAILGRALPLTGVWNPLAWPGYGLVRLGDGMWLQGIGFTLGLLLASGAVFALTLSTAERLYFSGWARVQVGTRARRRKKSRETPGDANERFSAFGAGLLPAPTRAVFRKDIRLFRRDLRNLSQLVFPIILAVIWTFTFFRDGSRSSQSGSILQLGGLGIGLFIGWTFATRFGMGSFSLEGKQWWILKTSPIASRHLLLAKFLMTVTPSVVFGLGYMVVAAIFQPTTLISFIYQSLALVLILAAVSSLMLSMGIWGARFNWSNPQEVQGGGMGCLASLAGFAALGITGTVFGGTPYLARFLDIPAWIVYLAGFGIGFVICLLIGTLPLAVAARRLPKLGETD
jgi:ABC-2 type transport system permease protein